MIAENGLEERGNQKVLSTLEQRKCKLYEILPLCRLLCQVVFVLFHISLCGPVSSTDSASSSYNPSAYPWPTWPLLASPQPQPVIMTFPSTVPQPL